MSRAWQKPETLDVDRENYCIVRLHDGRAMKALWTQVGPHRGTSSAARAWLCENNEVRGLYDVEAFSLLDSLPFAADPSGKHSDAELLADALGKRVEDMPAWISRKV